MKIDAISAYQIYPGGNNIRIKNTGTRNKIEHSNNVMRISFRGNPDKNPAQIAAFATECNFLKGIYTAGGLGDVASLLPESVGNKAKDIVGKDIDMRTFLPYYSMDDQGGHIYVLTKEGAERRKNLKDKELLDFKRDFKLVDQNYKLLDGERFAVITDIDGEGANKSVKSYFLLNDTGLNGSVERMSAKTFDMEKVAYRVFEVDTEGKRKDKIYLIHTPAHAKGRSAYGVYGPEFAKLMGNVSNNAGSTAYGASTANAYGASTANAYGASTANAYGASTAYGASGKIERSHFFSGSRVDDMYYTEQLRAYEQLVMEGKMNVDAHGKFNPQNHLIHDRFGYMALTDAVQKAKNGDKNFQGLVFDEILHNPGASYQGKYANPLDFFRIVATKEDLAKLQANEHYSKVTEIANKIKQGKATKEESEQIFKFFRPYFSKLMDTEGLFNMTMVAVKMTDENPKNSSIGNVSKNYGKETRNLKTTDIAKGLTQPLIDIESKTIDVVNGSKQANMATDKKGVFFGTGTLHETMKTKYNTYSPTDNPDKIFKAKAENKKIVIEELAKATKNLSTDNDALAKVFFGKDKIEKLRKNAANADDPNVKLVLGSMSEYKQGDMLFIGWGRPDPQKGMPVTLEAFENMLKDESIPLETRKHCKLVMGTGSGGQDMFTKASDEWKAIQEIVERIENLEVGGQKGIFKGNVVYTNGTFPARIANCADLGILTSRFEPCGITPLECFASGTPVISTNTGGAPDFIKPGKNGFLTKDPFMINPEEIGLKANATDKEIDVARRSHIAKQVAEQLKSYLEPIKNNSWEAKQKEFIKNCAGEKIEWHNNNAYNGGKSALEIYLKEKFNVMDNNVPDNYASDLRGEFDNTAFKKSGRSKGFGEKIKSLFQTKAGKWTAGIAGTAAIIGLGYTGYKKGLFSTKYEEKKNDDNLSLSRIA